MVVDLSRPNLIGQYYGIELKFSLKLSGSGTLYLRAHSRDHLLHTGIYMYINVWHRIPRT